MKREPGKVYCRDCRWHENHSILLADCRAEMYNYESPQNRTRRDPCEVNKHGDCPDYSRKWYKFWAPEGAR